MACGVARDSPRTKPWRCVEAGISHTAVIKRDAFALAVLQEQLAIVRSVERFANLTAHPLWLHVGSAEKQVICT